MTMLGRVMADKDLAPLRGPDGATFCSKPAVPQRRSLLDGMTSEQRKQYPLVTGCIDYFRDALLAISHVSYKGNLKHNKDQPLHWARSKSADELDALGRHLGCRGDIDLETGPEEAAQMCWRALAYYQKLLEKKHNITPPPGCRE